MASRAINPRYTKSLTDPRHMLRFLKSEAGVTPAEIAKAEGVSQETVRRSIKDMEEYRLLNTTGEVDFAVRDAVRQLMPTVRDTMHGLLTATEIVEVTDKKSGTKKEVLMPDKTTRLEAVKVAKSLVEVLTPKGPQVAVQLTNNNANVQATNTAAETTEERLRRLRKQAREFDALPAQVAAVPEYIDAGEDADDDDDDEEEGDEDGD